MSPRGRPPTRSQSRAKSANAVPLAPEDTLEGHVQTLLEGPAETPTLGQPQPTGPVPIPAVLPAQLQAADPNSKPVPRRKHRDKPPTPSSPGSTSTPELPSSDSSSSSRSTSPKRKKKGKMKQKGAETRGRPSPFIEVIASTKIPKALEKPTQLPTYTGKGDPDEHVDTFDLTLDYQGASDNVRYKLFPLSLTKSVLKWYRELSPASIKSWSQFTHQFSARFISSRVKLKSTDILQGIKQREKKTLREYLERYNQTTDDVHHLSDDIRVMFIRHNLWKSTLFRQEVVINKPQTMEEFMKKAQAYIDYEEAEAVTSIDADLPKARPNESNDKKKKDDSKEY